MSQGDGPKEGLATLLADDWDVLVLCTRRSREDLIRSWSAALRGFVERGKGILVVMDYYPEPGVDFDSGNFAATNEITRPAGFVFNPIVLGYSSAFADIACVPDF